ncbi:NUDIX domain-containing protein [Streptomyces sp. URMC 129]|uniref:NUDIX domain-containing protein n=1 Tax=Streptomyces sp. URMC 129 TaxID=3423407 RepID=UPI003F1D0F55
MATLNEHEAKTALPRMAAGALFFDGRGDILLVEPTYKRYRDLPGGYVEAGESPRQACEREVAEELGITPVIGRLLVVDWAPHPAEGDKVLWIFDGGVLPEETRAAIRLRDGELRGFAFCPVESVSELTIPRLAARVTAAVAARTGNRTDYLEHGGSA